ncbi:probable G-protein coupled receptor 25 [Hypanus sabinus]|uniref:probable G-protein coupled receptor 25 n=1 Tax=Hypanus sabinus TaxID=79690 RepID=UPI0028C4AF72|nr:probable G-protein coupled receptor 25 [Hypanus sabinus]
MANSTEEYGDYYYYNGGDDGSHSCQPPPGAGDFLCTAYSLTFALGLPANLLLLLVAGAQAWQRGPGAAPGPFVPALALADLILVLPLPLWADTWRREGSWRFSEEACRAGAYLAAAGAHASVLLLALTSLERLLAAARPGTHGRLRPRSRALLLALGVWATALILAMGPPTAPRRGTLPPGLSLAYWAGTFALPLGLILACNWEVGRRLRGGPLQRRRRDRRMRRSVALVRAVAAAFAACWLPFRALQAAGLANRWRGGAPSCSLCWAQEVTAPLAFASAVANPTVYLLCAEWPRRTLGCLLARRGSAEATGTLHTSSVTLG